MKYFINHWESDCCILTEYLEYLEYYSGSDRLQRQFKSMLQKKGTGSMLYGCTWKGYLKKLPNGTKLLREKSKEFKSKYNTKCKTLYPELGEVLKEFGQLYFPAFEWSQAQLNKNYQCPPHFDSVNIGESILLTLGDFTGGKTIVELDESSHIHYNSHYKLTKFNGSKYKHWTTDFEGTRYAIVFFNNSKLTKL